MRAPAHLCGFAAGFRVIESHPPFFELVQAERCGRDVLMPAAVLLEDVDDRGVLFDFFPDCGMVAVERGKERSAFVIDEFDIA
jgi:hypothetical protein